MPLTAKALALSGMIVEVLTDVMGCKPDHPVIKELCEMSRVM